MKKSTLITICILLTVAVLAQAPQGISHQAVIRDANNQLVTESVIGIKVSIIQESIVGDAIYSETHTPTSNANGLISFVIGQGTVLSGVFAEIDWSSGSYYLKTEADPQGGSNYTISGVTQLLSVPYALFSNNSEKAKTLRDGISPGEILFWNGAEWVAIPPGVHDQTLRLCNGIPTWGPCPYTLVLHAEPTAAGTVSGAGQYVAGDQFSISSVANEGWEFVNWTGDIEYMNDPDSEEATVTMPASDVTLTANFELAEYSLTLVANPSAGGSANGGGIYNLGDEINLTAETNEGWEFVNWTDVNGVISELQNFYFTMPAIDITLTANFEMINYSLTLVANPTEGGSVSGGSEYNIGDEVQVEAIANSGWEFVNWTDANGVVSESSNFLFIMPAVDVTLYANFEEESFYGQPCPDMPTVADIDGNIYNTVFIEGQCWMKENLKATKYNNGTQIEYPGLDNTAWQNNTTGAHALYNNDIIWKDSYGALYNWHAVNNANDLCPTGWHVPTDAEVTVLINYLGGTSVAGGKMKSTRTVPDPHPRWESPNGSATNETNWSGLPGGYRFAEGSFHSFGSHSYFWSSTEYSSTDAYGQSLNSSNGVVNRITSNKTDGFSVRCLRD